MDYIWLAILIALGLLMLFKPQLLWKIENMFTVKNGEPTELYLTLMKVGGIFFIAAGLIVLIVSVINH